MNMKLAISTVDPPLGAVEPPEVRVAAEAGVEDADELAPSPLELEPHPATARTAISATTAMSGRRGPTEDSRDTSARFISASFTSGEPA
ncbi:MAG TPA: hypothetical protein VII16_04165 [Actinomycetes bacterium]